MHNEPISPERAKRIVLDAFAAEIVRTLVERNEVVAKLGMKVEPLCEGDFVDAGTEWAKKEAKIVYYDSHDIA